MSLTTTEITLAYELLLNRHPTDAELANMMQHHQTLASLRTAFMNSDEFDKKYLEHAQESAGDGGPTLLHLHIPCTAGTTLARALSQNPKMKPNMICHDRSMQPIRRMSRPKRQELRYLRGHLMMGAGDLMGTPYINMCLIRKPGPRLFSFYQAILRTENHPAHKALTENEMSFGDYLEYSVNHVRHRMELDNGQVRRLSGHFTEESIGHERLLLQLALHHALSPQNLIGFVEHFDSFADRLVEEGYLPQAKLEKFNVSPGDSTLYDKVIRKLTSAQRDIFDSYIAWDDYLYTVCETLMPAKS